MRLNKFLSIILTGIICLTSEGQSYFNKIYNISCYPGTITNLSDSSFFSGS